MSTISYSAAQIAKIVSPTRTAGATSDDITSINSLADAVAGELTFLGNKKYKLQVRDSRASIILLPLDYEGIPHDGQMYMFCENPSLALGLMCRDIETQLAKQFLPGVHKTAVIDVSSPIHPTAHIGANVVVEENAEIAENVVIEPGCFIGRGVKIGKNSHLQPGVKVMDFCIVGSRVILYAGAVIGSDGFGYETVNGVHEKIPQIGNVVLEDDVEIGANTTIDRARFKSTVIGRGTKIDNLVQIAHNVKIGKGCLIVSQVGISGSTTLGNYVVVGGQTGIVGHLKIGDGCMFGGQTGVGSDCEPGTFYRGSPEMPYALANKYFVLRKRLPELFNRVDALEKAVKND